MTDYIDRQKLLKDFGEEPEVWNDDDDLSIGYLQEWRILRRYVETAPTVDAVPAVRCKDCKYLSMTTIGMDYACWHGAESVYGQTGEHAGQVVCQRIESPDHFCAYGERRDPDA